MIFFLVDVVVVVIVAFLDNIYQQFESIYANTQVDFSSILDLKHL